MLLRVLLGGCEVQRRKGVMHEVWRLEVGARVDWADVYRSFDDCFVALNGSFFSPSNFRLRLPCSLCDFGVIEE